MIRITWSRLMLECGCVEWREVKPGTSRPDDILKQVKPTLTPHYFRHNYVTLLYESGIDPLVAMKIVGVHPQNHNLMPHSNIH